MEPMYILLSTVEMRKHQIFFELLKDERRCFYVWINGFYIGYSQVSHMTSEFDVTDVLQDGTNTVAVLVMKWCDGCLFGRSGQIPYEWYFPGCVHFETPKTGNQ